MSCLFFLLLLHYAYFKAFWAATEGWTFAPTNYSQIFFKLFLPRNNTIDVMEKFVFQFLFPRFFEHIYD